MTFPRLLCCPFLTLLPFSYFTRGPFLRFFAPSLTIPQLLHRPFPSFLDPPLSASLVAPSSAYLIGFSQLCPPSPPYMSYVMCLSSPLYVPNLMCPHFRTCLVSVPSHPSVRALSNMPFPSSARVSSAVPYIPSGTCLVCYALPPLCTCFI